MMLDAADLDAAVVEGILDADTKAKLVAWALMCATSSIDAPACSSAIFIARAAAEPSGSGAVTWYESLVTDPPASSA